MAEQAECIFCRIVRGDIPATVVYEDTFTFAFRDVQPAAPTHVLIVPREHIASLHDLTAAHDELMAALLRAAQRVAEQEGIAQQGYRVATNVGEWGGQSVAHLHLHVLGGRQLKALG